MKNLISIIFLFLMNASIAVSQGASGFTPLHEAVKDNDFPLVKSLISDNADVNSPAGPGGFTPLAVAVFKLNYKLTKYLLKHKANINQTSSDGATVLHMALKENADPKMLKLLLKHGADPHLIVTSEGVSPLMLLAQSPLTDKEALPFVNDMLRKKVDVNVQDHKKGRTALMYAVVTGKVAVVKRLVRAKANMNLKTKDGDTALSLAINVGKNKKIIKLLGGKSVKPALSERVAKGSASSKAVITDFLLMINGGKYKESLSLFQYDVLTKDKITLSDFTSHVDANLTKNKTLQSFDFISEKQEGGGLVRLDVKLNFKDGSSDTKWVMVKTIDDKVYLTTNGSFF